MAFDGTEGSQITLQEANQMRQKYMNANPGATEGLYIGKEILQQIMNQQGCVGLSCYLGIDEHETYTQFRNK